MNTFWSELGPFKTVPSHHFTVYFRDQKNDQLTWPCFLHLLKLSPFPRLIFFGVSFWRKLCLLSWSKAMLWDMCQMLMVFWPRKPPPWIVCIHTGYYIYTYIIYIYIYMCVIVYVIYIYIYIYVGSSASWKFYQKLKQRPSSNDEANPTSLTSPVHKIQRNESHSKTPTFQHPAQNPSLVGAEGEITWGIRRLLEGNLLSYICTLYAVSTYYICIYWTTIPRRWSRNGSKNKRD